MSTATTYYKYKLLQIIHKSGVAYLPLTRERGFITETPYDSDEEDYDYKVREYQANILESKFRPIEIYNQNKGFLTPLYREKYGQRIADRMRQGPTDTNYFTAWKDSPTDFHQWSDILTIYKIEKREMRKNFSMTNPYVKHIEYTRLQSRM